MLKMSRKQEDRALYSVSPRLRDKQASGETHAQAQVYLSIGGLFAYSSLISSSVLYLSRRQYFLL